MTLLETERLDRSKLIFVPQRTAPDLKDPCDPDAGEARTLRSSRTDTDRDHSPPPEGASGDYGIPGTSSLSLRNVYSRSPGSS